MDDSPTQMEPLLPTSRTERLVELAVELVRQSAALGSQFRSSTRTIMTASLRQMNSYYSNLIEGHHTHPLDIERALKQEYSDEPAKRLLQLESKAHIEVQKLIEAELERSPETNICSSQFLTWIHHAFYERMPLEFRWITDKEQKERHEIVPGELRNREVVVGRGVALAETPRGAVGLPWSTRMISEMSNLQARLNSPGAPERLHFLASRILRKYLPVDWTELREAVVCRFGK